METSKLDPKLLAKALHDLLAILPAGFTGDVKETSSSDMKRLRSDVDIALARLLSLSKILDPIQQPAFVFDPTNPEQIGKLIGRTMMEQPRHPLSKVPKFYGSGVYAIYYNGEYDVYRPIRRKDSPIYVGKTDPNTPDAKTVQEQGPRLSGRLAEHAKSVKAATSSLSIDDFECRFLVIQSGWQRAAEDYLVSLFKPIWNTRICYGFGKHGDDPKTRANSRSPWDTLHPGRAWATKEGNIAGITSVTEVKAQIDEHYRKHPPLK